MSIMVSNIIKHNSYTVSSHQLKTYKHNTVNTNIIIGIIIVAVVAVKMDSGGMIYIPSFMKTGKGVQN
jgi:hypothetical protein